MLIDNQRQTALSYSRTLRSQDDCGRLSAQNENVRALGSLSKRVAPDKSDYRTCGFGRDSTCPVSAFTGHLWKSSPSFGSHRNFLQSDFSLLIAARGRQMTSV